MVDTPSRQIQIDICIPCYLLQVSTPVLLGSGMIDNPRIHHPISIWIPKYTDERMVPSARLENRIGEKVHSLIREWVVRYTEFFAQISGMFMDPTDAVPMLPLGTYVDVTYRCSIDVLPSLLEGLQKIPIAGIPEFQFALAEIFHSVLRTVPTEVPKLGR